MISKKLLELAERADLQQRERGGYPRSSAIAGAIHVAAANAYRVAAGMAEEQERLTAEVVAELHRMAHICSARAESSGSRAFDTAADLVEEKLVGVKP